MLRLVVALTYLNYIQTSVATRLKKRSTATALILCSWVLLAGCEGTSVRRPFVRSEAATAAIQNFKAASIVESEPASEQSARVWNAALVFGKPPIQAKVTGRAHMSTIAVVYGDGVEHGAFEPADYTNTIEVRVKDSTLYVYRNVTLLWVEYRLAVFDLANRKQIADFLISPDDMR